MGILKAHSVRGAVASKAACSGVTISDILQAADRSSESTFRKFYHRLPANDESQSTYGQAILSAEGASTYILMELSEI